MYKKSIAITAVLVASVLSVIAITTPFAYASTESETNTEINNKERATASGDSTINQCSNNLIGSANGELPLDVIECFESPPLP